MSGRQKKKKNRLLKRQKFWSFVLERIENVRHLIRTELLKLFEFKVAYCFSGLYFVYEMIDAISII